MDYQKVYTSLIHKRRINPLTKSKDLYTELHHIVPRCLGGTDEPENLVRLSGREHFVAHRLLCKIHPQNNSLRVSLWCMASTRSLSISSGRVFESLKKEHFEKEEIRSLLSRAGRKKWSDPEYREMRSQSASDKWQDSEYRNKMVENNREIAFKRWADQDYRTKTLVTLRKGQKEWLNSFLETNPWPWQKKTNIRTRNVWCLAATFWELSKFNPDCKKPIGAQKFCSFFLNGQFTGVVDRMFKMFREGWVPQRCEAFTKVFGERM